MEEEMKQMEEMMNYLIETAPDNQTKEAIKMMMKIIFNALKVEDVLKKNNLHMNGLDYVVYELARLFVFEEEQADLIIRNARMIADMVKMYIQYLESLEKKQKLKYLS